MRNYLVTVPVKIVSGVQVYRIEASSEEAALVQVKAGGGDCIEESLEVESLDWSAATVEHMRSSLVSDEEIPE